MHPDTRICPQLSFCTLTNSWLRDSLYRDTRIAHKTCTWTAKSAPYPPCTVTVFWLIPMNRDCPVLSSGNTTSPYCRAVNNNTGEHRDIRLPTLQVILFTVTRQFFAVNQVCTATLHWSFSNFDSGDKSCSRDKLLRQPHNLAMAHIKNWLPAAFC